jgi:redox-regulated HSP33 family molecular chaperone
LIVTKVLYRLQQPIISTVPLGHGDVTSDVANYFQLSEQTPSLIFLHTDLKNQTSGGFLFQTFPHASEEILRQIKVTLEQENVKKQVINSFRRGSGQKLTDILPFILEKEHLNTINEQAYDTYPVAFHCRHSKQKLMDTLMSYGPSIINELGLNEEPFLRCQYCNEKVALNAKDLEKLEKSSTNNNVKNVTNTEINGRRIE